ncbi:MAG: hypothetical protein KGI28_02290 [Thaumarchaeota archaeon]|nr:hypothetical protein [Nitrososphaerota archaeon]
MSSREFVLPALMIKDLDIFLLQLKQIPKVKSFAAAKSSLKLFISQVDKIIESKDFQNDALWKSYHTSLGILRKYLLPENEKDSYDKEDTEFTKQAFDMLVKYLEKNKEFLKRPNYILKSILLEMNRFYQEFGIDERDVKARMLIVVINYIYDYIEKSDLTDEKIRSEVEISLIPFVDKIIHTLEPVEIQQPDIDNLIVDIIMLWRDQFLRYGELLTLPTETPNRRSGRLNLPEETKDKISKLITQGLEDQIRKAK